MDANEQPTQQFTHNTIFGLGITFSVLSILTVIARFYCRLKLQASLSRDDWMIIPALITALGTVAVTFAALYLADLGKQYPKTSGPSPDHLPLVIVHLQKCVYAASILLVAPLTFSKLSVLYLYRRIFSGERFRKGFYAVFGIVSAWGVVFTVIYIADCAPVSDFWTKEFTTQAAHCISYDFNKAFGFTNIAMDALVLALPVPMVLRLQLSTGRKIAVLMVFVLGAIVLGIGVAQTVAFYQLFKVVVQDHDLTYDDAGFFYFAVPQACLSVVAACLSALTPLYKKRDLASIVRSNRSAVSLNSLRSNKSQKGTGSIGT